MNYNVLEARLVRDYVVWLRFRDGTTGEVDLKDELWGEVFEPLNDPSTSGSCAWILNSRPSFGPTGPISLRNSSTRGRKSRPKFAGNGSRLLREPHGQLRGIANGDRRASRGRCVAR